MRDVEKIIKFRDTFKELVDIYDRFIELAKKEENENLTDDEEKEVVSLLGRIVLKSLEIKELE